MLFVAVMALIKLIVTFLFFFVAGVEGENERFFSRRETGGRDGGAAGFERPPGRRLRKGMETQTNTKPNQTKTNQAKQTTLHHTTPY